MSRGLVENTRAAIIHMLSYPVDRDIWTIASIASSSGVLGVLLEVIGDVNLISGRYKQSPLSCAAGSGNRVLDSGSDLNLPSQSI